MEQKFGFILFIIALLFFTALPTLDNYRLTPDTLAVSKTYHRQEVLAHATALGLVGREYPSVFGFCGDLKDALKKAQQSLNAKATAGIPAGVNEWDFKLGDWELKEYLFQTAKKSGTGWVSRLPWLFFALTIGLGCIGGILIILPEFKTLPGIRNNHIYHAPLTRGLRLGWRSFFLGATFAGVIIYGVFYMNGDPLFPMLSIAIAALITGLVFYYEKQKPNKPSRSASPGLTAWLGVLTGAYLIGFYVVLYWSPQYTVAWVTMVNPLSRALSGSDASQWFLYGLLYTIAVLVMGVRMIAKYRHNRYQIVRTFSVMFFQTAFAFLIPEMLVRLNQPYYDFKNIWPLNYTFFFDWNLNNLLQSGGLGIFMLVWGIALIVIAVPLLTYFFGKRWYCSWVCGCGGLAETLGDPWRQLSDKSLRAWKFERWIIHGVLLFAVLMTGLVLYTYFTGAHNVLFLNSDSVRGWYGFFIGSGFAGVVGTGFYPLMGNRVWCRFGCPLAAYLGLVQKYRSRFRITVNGGQCISCGNCSTYCEMGIDVRWYAQRGQDVVRASCVGCGICAAVCPRGVLRLENAGEDVGQRTKELRIIHVKEGEVGMLG